MMANGDIIMLTDFHQDVIVSFKWSNRSNNVGTYKKLMPQDDRDVEKEVRRAPAPEFASLSARCRQRKYRIMCSLVSPPVQSDD